MALATPSVWEDRWDGRGQAVDHPAPVAGGPKPPPPPQSRQGLWAWSHVRSHDLTGRYAVPACTGELSCRAAGCRSGPVPMRRYHSQSARTWGKSPGASKPLIRLGFPNMTLGPTGDYELVSNSERTTPYNETIVICSEIFL